MKRSRGLAAAVVLGATLASPPAIRADATSTSGPASPALADYLQAAEANNPALAAARHATDADVATVARAGSWPDPQLSVGWFLSPVETRVGPQEQRLALRQRLPWARGTAREAAARTADVSRARAEEIRATLRRDVAQAWWDAYLLERTIAITSRNLELVVDLERVVREKYRTGEAGRLDLGRAHIELGRVEDRVRGLRDRVPAVRARLASLLSLPDGSSLPLPVDADSVPSAPSSDRVTAQVGPAAPRLATADARVEEAGARRALAGRASWPDLMLGVEWIRTGDARAANVAGSGDDPWVVSVTADLPIFRGKIRGAVEEAEAREAATRSERRRTEDELRAAAESARVDWADADRRIALYRDGLVPEAADSREAAFAAYRAGDATFLDLVDAERLLLELSIEEERARADRGRAAAALEFVTGRDWTGEGIR